MTKPPFPFSVPPPERTAKALSRIISLSQLTVEPLEQLPQQKQWRGAMQHTDTQPWPAARRSWGPCLSIRKQSLSSPLLPGSSNSTQIELLKNFFPFGAGGIRGGRCAAILTTPTRKGRARTLPQYKAQQLHPERNNKPSPGHPVTSLDSF